MVSDEHLTLQILPLRRYLLREHEESVNQILVALQPRANLKAGPTRNNIMLVIDDSGSMSGAPIQQVLLATRAIVSRLRPWDRLGIVGFGDEAELVHPLADISRRQTMLRATEPWAWSHGRRGYGTNMAAGLRIAERALRAAADPEHVNRIIILTDGNASNPEATMEVARLLARQRIAMVSLGFGGDFDMDFMDGIASLSGGACEYIDPRTPRGAIENFVEQLSRIQDQLTDNTTLTLRFAGQHRVRDYWQTHPRVIYHGLVETSAEHVWSRRLADVERREGLELLFTMIHPKSAESSEHALTVDVEYDLPGLGLRRQQLSGELHLEYGDDGARWAAVESRVQQRYNDAFVEKQQARARALIAQGQTSQALRVLGTIKKRGRGDVKEMATGTMKKLKEEGRVSSEELYRLKMGTQKKRPAANRDERTSSPGGVLTPPHPSDGDQNA